MLSIKSSLNKLLKARLKIRLLAFVIAYILTVFSFTCIYRGLDKFGMGITLSTNLLDYDFKKWNKRIVNDICSIVHSGSYKSHFTEESTWYKYDCSKKSSSIVDNYFIEVIAPNFFNPDRFELNMKIIYMGNNKSIDQNSYLINKKRYISITGYLPPNKEIVNNSTLKFSIESPKLESTESKLRRDDFSKSNEVMRKLNLALEKLKLHYLSKNNVKKLVGDYRELFTLKHGANSLRRSFFLSFNNGLMRLDTEKEIVKMKKFTEYLILFQQAFVSLLLFVLFGIQNKYSGFLLRIIKVKRSMYLNYSKS